MESKITDDGCMRKKNPHYNFCVHKKIDVHKNYTLASTREDSTDSLNQRQLSLLLSSVWR
jgi:hypothetical protein